MEKKFLKISNVLLKVFLVTMAVLSMGAFIFALLGKSLSNFDFKYLVYLSFGVIFTPLEYLINGTVGQMFESVFLTMIFALSVVVFFLMILIFTYKTKASRNEEYRRVYYSVVSNVILLVILPLLIFNVCILLINYRGITYHLANTAPIIAKTLGENFIILLYIILTFIGIVFITLNILACVFSKKKVVKGIKIYGTTNFYSKEYEEQQNEIQVKQQQEETQVEVGGIKESKEEAKELVLKIMQLQELRTSGQISDVEYTKLRQKAIKRYKG